MKTGSVILLSMLAGVPALAAPIDFTTGITTGVELQAGTTTLRQGLAVTSTPIQDFLAATRPYSSQVVPTGSTNEVNEAFVEAGDPRSFSSARGDGAGALEVGVDRNTFSSGSSLAVSRWYTTIKNNTDDEVQFDISLDFAPGSVEIEGTRYVAERSRAHIFAILDYVLKTPDAGTYIETAANLYKYDLLITNEGPNGTVHASPTVVPWLSNHSTRDVLSYKVEPFVLLVVAPTIPARGELTLYYDMYAFHNNRAGENPGAAFIGDPLDLVQKGGISVRPRTDAVVPEPATVLLFPAGLAGVVWAQARRGRRA